MNVPLIVLISIVGLILFTLVFTKLKNLIQFRVITRSGSFHVFDKLLFIFSILIIIVVSIWDYNYLANSKSIPHKDWETITLNDFKGLKDPTDNLDGETRFAFVSTNISVRKLKDRVEVVSKFHPCRSYVFNRRLFANSLLTHEMYHFHITEYCARLMRNEIQNSIDSISSFSVYSLKMKYLNIENQLQFKYDDDTYHSYVLGKQIEWQEKIDSMLLSVENYSNTDIYYKTNP